MRPGDENLEAAAEQISRDPRFVRCGDVPSGSLDSRFYAFAPSGWDTFGLEDRDGHLLSFCA